MTAHPPQRLLLVTGMSGAGKSTALNTLEDLGWEAVDNMPLLLLEPLLETPAGRGTPGWRNGRAALKFQRTTQQGPSHAPPHADCRPARRR